MLSLMCGIYSSENYIPRNRPDVYEKCALLLFEKWDKQRGINAPLSFDAHVQAAMRSLALWLYPQQASQQGLPRNKLIDFMKSYLLEKRFDDEYEAENAAAEFIDFCKGRAWVLTDIGSELYGFTHRTFLEYFAASQIVRLNPDPVKLFEYLESRLKGGGWEVVAQLALQIINKTVEDGADDFLAVLLERATSLDDARLRSVLLAFSTQALTYIVPRPPVLRSVVQSAVNMFCGRSVSSNSKPNGNTDEVGPMYMLLGASPENLPLVSKYTYDYLVDKLQDNPDDELSLSLALYPDQHSTNLFLRNTSYRGTLDNEAFWAGQSRLNWTRFVNSIEVQRLSHSWVEAYMFECDHASTSEFLSRFPVRELYEVSWSPEMGGGFVMALVPRIWLQFGPERRANPRSRISLDRIDELRKALINVPTPWFTSADPTGLGGIVEYVMDLVSARLRNQQFNDSQSISSFLFFAATLLDLGGESGPRRPRPGNDENSLIRELYRLVIMRQKTLSGDETVDRLAGREQLVHLGVDDLTADALARWLSDRTFCFIRHKSKRQPRTSKR